MTTPSHHIFVCTTSRPIPSGPSCSGAGSGQVLNALPMLLMDLGIENVQVNGCTCLGPCEVGANMVIYPEGIFYRKVNPSNIRELLESHFVKGEAFAPLLVS